MAQRFCEICSDPLELDSTGTICENCETTIQMQVETMEIEEKGCETPALAEGLSLSETPSETGQGAVASTSESSAASDVTSGSESESPVSLSQTDQTAPTKKPKPTLPCDGCGVLCETLTKFKHPTAGGALELCDICLASEKAILEPQDEAMQGKLVHPDEANRDEVISMDDEDRVLYNDEVRISIESPIEDVYKRITLLENRLQRAKVQLKASKQTLFMRIEHMKKEEREAEYKRLGEVEAKKRRAKSPVGVGAEGGAAPKRTASRPRRTKAEQFRDSMRSNGFEDAWIDEQIKKMGLE